MSSTFFISDLHLDSARPNITRALADFLQQRTRCDHLYILGDLFDAWLGDDDDAPLARQVRTLLAEFSASGPSLHIMQGNRDFLLGEAFCQSVGGQLLPDPAVIDLYGTRTLLLHGDSLCTSDRDYQAIRKTTRHADWQAGVLRRSLEERRTLATQLRVMSGEAKRKKPAEMMDASPEAVESAMKVYDTRQCIHGHTHRPAKHETAAGIRWVLGDWGQVGWAIEASPNNINLFNFLVLQ